MPHLHVAPVIPVVPDTNALGHAWGKEPPPFFFFFFCLLEEMAFIKSVISSVYGFMSSLQPFRLVAVALAEVALILSASITNLLTYTV